MVASESVSGIRGEELRDGTYDREDCYLVVRSTSSEEEKNAKLDTTECGVPTAPTYATE